MFFSKDQLEKWKQQGQNEARRMEEKRRREEEGERFRSSANLVIECPHCKHDRFTQDKALLNTRGLSFLNLDWLNEGAHTLMCTNCGMIIWFGKDIHKLE